jgi:anti-anti-sigma factor
VPEIGQIVVEHLPDVSVVALCGEHDISTAGALQAELNAIVATGANVIVDLSETTFIDSSIVGAVFHAPTTPGRIVAVTAPPSTLPRRVIDLIALSAAIPTFDSRKAAVAYAATKERT